MLIQYETNRESRSIWSQRGAVNDAKLRALIIGVVISIMIDTREGRGFAVLPVPSYNVLTIRRMS